MSDNIKKQLGIMIILSIVINALSAGLRMASYGELAVWVSVIGLAPPLIALFLLGADI